MLEECTASVPFDKIALYYELSLILEGQTLPKCRQEIS